MADFIAQNHIQNRHRVQVAHLAQLGLNAGRDVQPARFQRARHQRQPRQQVVGGALGHVPQAVVSRKIPILVAQGVQGGRSAAENARLLPAPRPASRGKTRRQAGKAPDDVQRQVNGVEFDMRQRVDQAARPSCVPRPRWASWLGGISSGRAGRPGSGVGG